MSEQEMKDNEFAELLRAQEEEVPEVKQGDVVKAEVVAVTDKDALVSIKGLKSDIPIVKRELAQPEPDKRCRQGWRRHRCLCHESRR